MNYILIILLITLHNCESNDKFYVNSNVVLHKNELTEAQKDEALGIGLSQLANGTQIDLIADNLIKHFSNQYGGQWYCMITTSAFAAKFDSQPNSLIWYSIDSIHVILFRPGFMYPKDAIQESKHINPKISIFKSEMNTKMNTFAINMSLIAINAYNEYHLIAKNISETFDGEFGKYWNCFIGQKGFDVNINYINGSYINLIIEDLELIIFQTNQPKYKTDFISLLNEAKSSEMIVYNKSDVFMLNNIKEIVNNCLTQNFTNDCYVDYERNITIEYNSCYDKIAKYMETKLYDKYKNGWSVSVGDHNYYSVITKNENNYFKFSFGRLLFIISDYIK